MGWWDGAHAQVGTNGPNDIPFIWDGAFYLKPTGSTAANTISISSQYGTFEATPGNGNVKVCVYPENISLDHIEFLKVCYKKKGSWHGICHDFITVQNPTDYCFYITGLQSGEDYKLKAFYGQKPYIGKEYKIGVINSITIL